VGRKHMCREVYRHHVVAGARRRVNGREAGRFASTSVAQERQRVTVRLTWNQRFLPLLAYKLNSARHLGVHRPMQADNP